MYGMTPLQVAVKYHQGVIARRLTGTYKADPNASKVLDAVLTAVTLMPQRGLLKSISFAKHQAISQHIATIVPKQSNSWNIFLDPIKTEDAGTPPLVTAFQSKQYGVVKFFIEYGANYQPLFEHATLEDICWLEKMSFIQFVIQNQLHTTQINYEKVFDVVVKLGNTDLMNYFLDCHQIHSGILEKALIQACQNLSQDMVRLLIKHDECLVKAIQHDSSNHCHHPLCIAIRNSDVTMASILHKGGAVLFNVSSGETSLHYTLCEDSLKNLCSRQDELSDILLCLLPECIDQNTLTSALIAACKEGCARAARLLVSKGADVNRCNVEGNSPLRAAICQHRTQLLLQRHLSSQLVTLLLTKGADPNRTYPESQHSNKHRTKTVLCDVCALELFEIASKLIDAGAYTNPESCSPLLKACERNHIDIVELLLENKADPNWSSSKGHILNITHDLEHYEVVRLLLEYGAEPSVLSGIGLKAACELYYTEVAQHIIHESHVSPDVLEQCIECAFNNGFLEAVLEAMVDISE